MKPRGTEILAGYVLLGIGLLFIVLPSSLAISLFVSGKQIPEFIPSPAGNQSDTASSITAFSNACLVLFLLAIPVWAGSIITSRSITMVKDVRLKLMRKNLKEAENAAEKTDIEES
jgi:hypothetical protein